jgi:hemolysin III
MFRENDIQLFININYAVLACMVLLPVVAFLIVTKFKDGIWVGIALTAFIVALTFRIVDTWRLTVIGTHFLWHTFGAVAAFCMFKYIYLINERKLLVK